MESPGFCQAFFSRLNFFSNMKKKNLLKQFADEHRMIAYHAEWRKITGSVTATILLQQINYLWDTHGNKPFYKFREPCKNPKYREGDSWIEELGFSDKEFDSAIQRIGQKRSQARIEKDPNILAHAKPVEYWTDEHHLTWYQIHETNFLTMLSTIYETPQKQACGECAYFLKEELGNSANGNQEIAKKENSGSLKGETDLIPKKGIRESPIQESDLLDQRTHTKKRSQTETTTEQVAPAIPNIETDSAAAVAVVSQINFLISKTRKGEAISIVTLKQISATHQVDPDEILLAAQALADIPTIKSIAGMLLGSKNDNGHHSPCFEGGKCVLTPHAPEPPPIARTKSTLRELTEAQLRAQYAQLDDATRAEITREPMERMMHHQHSMSAQTWNETIEVGIPALMREYLIRNDLMDEEEEVDE